MGERGILGGERQPASTVDLEQDGRLDRDRGRGARTPVEQRHLAEELPRLDDRHRHLFSVTRDERPHPAGDDDVELGREVPREVDVLPEWDGPLGGDVGDVTE